MVNKYSFLTLLITVVSFTSFGQTKEYGIWNSIGLEQKINKLTLNTELELRTINAYSDIKRANFDLGISYSIVKPIKVGIKYQYIYFNDIEFSDMQPRQRYNLNVQGKHKIGDFTFSLREQVQRTLKDERDRILPSGKYDTYKMNPEWEWRNKLKIRYNIPHIKLDPSFSAETYFHLNNPDGNSYSKLRLKLAFDYKISKRQKVQLYGLFDKELNVTYPTNTYVVGLKYNFYLKKIKSKK